MSRRQILVTNALPYVNADIHLGHLLEHVQTDVWVRFQRMRGHEIRSFCGDDTHGTATMIRAQQEGRESEALLEEVRLAHERDLAAFDVVYDHYGSTHSPSNQRLVNEVWAALRSGGHTASREVTQLYDTEAGIFLADRFVKGSCPRCGAGDQYGDNCDACGAVYGPEELLDPKSTISGTRPELRSATHYFVELEGFHDFLAEWTQAPGRMPGETANWLAGAFLSEPLRDWDVSRPAPYFGFEIPDAPGHFFYVWLDAPVGYMSSTADWCEQSGEDFERWWGNESCEIHHFIGKDIAYFHTLFWPAMLRAWGRPLPARVQVHGFLTVNGEKMSKRKGTFVLARTYLEHLSPDYLRYYFATKLSSGASDMDLNLEEFVTKVNADLVGKVVNLASRTARFVEGKSLSTHYPDDGGLFAAAAELGDEIAEAYESCDTGKVTRLVMALADRANEYVESRAPWTLRKKEGAEDELVAVCSVALNLFHQIVVYLAPVLPKLAAEARDLLGLGAEPAWEEASTPLTGVSVGKFRHLMARVDPEHVAAMIAASAAPDASGDDSGEALAGEPLADEIGIEDFQKLDLRVARIESASAVDGADKLLELAVSLGGDERRTVFAGIKRAYEPEQLVGRLVVVVANLAPRKMRFGTSEAMVLAAGSDGRNLFLLNPDQGAVPGQRIR
jgi:methionyl-tRNA synthetase